MMTCQSESVSGDQITWGHTFIEKTGLAPGELVRQTLGYSPSYWEKWLRWNQHAVVKFNRKPWIDLAQIHLAGDQVESEQATR